MSTRIAIEPGLTILLGAFVVWGCGDDLTQPQTGTIEITSTTLGEPPDADGYTLAIDGGAPLAIGNNSTLELSDVTAGDHQIELGGVAVNCATDDPNPRPIVLSGGNTTHVTFQVECHTPSGSIRVLTTTRGEDLDPDGYTVTLDGGPSQAIASSGSLDLTGIMPGEHRVRLLSLARNCTVTGSGDRTLTVGNNLVELSLEVVCQQAFGSLVISIVAIGTPDPDRFTISVDSAEEQVTSSGHSLTISNLRVGDHHVRVGALPPHCEVLGLNPQTVTVSVTSPSTAGFWILCISRGLGTFLFSGTVGEQFHIFRLANDGTATDLTPTAQAERGRLSPDRTRIAFHSVRSGTLGIWVMNADGSTPVQLTSNGEMDPEWSPDGDQIVFWPDVTAGFGTVTVMNADGSRAHDIGTGSEPSWSNTGRIAFERADTSNCIFDICPLNLYTMKADGSDVLKLTSNRGALSYAVAPNWSPDGRRIAFYDHQLGAVSLKTMSADGSDIRTIATRGGLAGPGNESFTGAAVWSPDGRALAYAVTDSGGTSRILVTPVDGGNTEVILEREGLLEPTSWVR